MYTLGLQRDFIARHYLIGGDWGPENDLHAHHYRLEVRLEGDALDRHEYLVDLVDLEAQLDTLIEGYRDQTLNELPAFEGVNPSLERFARILCENLAARIDEPQLATLTVKLWENDVAWASYRSEL